MRSSFRPKRTLISAAVLSALSATARATELPLPCGAGSCGPTGPSAWVASGAASAALSNNSLTIQQTTDQVVLNWQSFNISADGTVTFRQPSANAIALNQIFQADPSRIFGALKADGRVFLINQNGILFGEGAVVNVGGLLASTLEMTPEALANGIAGAINDPTRPNSPAFRASVTAPGAPLVIEGGAAITTAEGGQVLMFAPRIEQRGSITTPGGQTLLAAGTTVYLAVSNDDGLRGLLVEVDAADALESTVTNGAPDGAALANAVGKIVAERGNVTLAGLAVNQNGRVSATTTVRQNGSIRLQARTGNIISGGGGAVQRGVLGGELTTGAGSMTEVMLSGDADDTTVDANVQPRSLVTLVGADVEILEGSRITANGGDIVVKAQENQASTSFSRTPDTLTPSQGDASRVYVAPSAVLDVSGADVDLPMERNVLRVELRGNQLRDSPVQRDGALRGETVFVDIRRSGTRADGTEWQGTAIADLTGDISTIPRSVAERNLVGGNVVLQSQGDVIVAPSVAIDVSGGVMRYADGFINTTQLVDIEGNVVDIGDADRDRVFDRTVSEYVRRHERWGVTDVFPGFPSAGQGAFERGYVEGYDAGTLTLVAPQAILDGAVTGAVTAGLYQRQPTAELAAGGRRPYDELPRGARLTLGRLREGAPEFVSAPLRFAGPGAALPALLNDQGLPFDPRTDSLPQTFGAVTLRTDLFGAGGIAEATLVSGDSIALAADQTIALPAGGVLQLTAPSVTIDGTITVPGGTVDVTAERTLRAAAEDRSSLVVGATARIDTSGRWVNDGELASPDRVRLAPLHIDGGTVQLASAAGDMRLAAGSSIDVSGGAYRGVDGAITAGRGGAIALETQSVPDGDRGLATVLELGAELRGYALADGGALSITAGEICIAPESVGGSTTEALYLDPDFFADGGFASYDLHASRDGLTVTGTVPVLLRQRNFLLPSDTTARPSGGSLLDFAGVVLLDELLRKPTDLSLRATAPAPATAYDDTSFLTAPLLRVDAGATIQADAGAALDLRTNSRIAFDGRLIAPSGAVSMRIDDTLALSTFLGAQGIRLGETAAIDLRGVAQIATNAFGARFGSVLDGGSLSLTATRGYVVFAAGSHVDVSGASGTLDIRARRNDTALTPVTIGSSAGTVALTAAEGIVLSGDLAAHAGVGSSIAGLRAGGGTLRIELDPSGRNDPLALVNQPSLFPTGARTIVLSESAAPLVIGPDSPVPADLNGRARIAADLVTAAGFDSLELKAGVLTGVNQTFQVFEVPGAIAFEGDVILTLPAALSLRAARLDLTSGRATLAAPYVTLGNADRNWFAALDPVAGSGALVVNAGFLELTGRTVIDGAATTMLTSAGDLRLRGLELPTTATALVGALTTAGDLTLTAAQVYATTLSDFTLAVSGNPTGTLTIASNGAAPKDVLSAASRLRLTAPSIVQAGTLRAPFGSIELVGDSVALRRGSLTSTSADGLTIPFGTTQGGFAWVYGLANVDLVYGAGELVPPAQSVALEGRDIDVAAGATIDLSGGGDLLAYEFVPGVGGSRDVLSAAVRPDEFAIVPSLAIDVAPYDAREYTGSALRVGDSIFLEAGAGLPAGEYVLLPARYALLPGAFLVRAADGYQDIVPDEAFGRLDGAAIVSGYRTLAATGIATGGTRRTGFAVRSADLARREATYTTTLANDYFAAEAAALESAVPRLPRDAGVLALNSTELLRLDGTLRANAGESGRGAAVDVSATQLRVAQGGGGATVPGEVVIDAASLNRLDAESLLLGGRRTTASDGTGIAIVAERLTIAAGTELTAPELLLGARDSLLVETDTKLSGLAENGEGVAPQRYLLTGDAAFLRVSGGAQAAVERTGETGALGSLDIRSGATIDAGAGAILLDASRDTTLLGELVLAGGSLNLGSSSITLDAAGVAASGLVLTNDDLARLDIAELVLTSRSTVDLSGGIALDLKRLVVDAAGLRGLGGGSASINVTDTVRLTNTAGLTLTPAAGTGTLALRAASIELGRGEFALDGFAASTLSSVGGLTFENGARLATSGDLSWSGAYVTGTAGASGALDVTGRLSLARSGAPLASPKELGLGARLDLSARDIAADGAILLPGGTVSLRARGVVDPLVAGSGSVVLGGNALIDVRGQSRFFDGVAMQAPGGRVTLTAERGDVVLASGATVDVSGATDGGAGDVTLFAGGTVSLAGRLLGHGSPTAGGALTIDAESFGGYAAVAAQAVGGGFTAALHLRQRGAGDLVVGGETLRAHDVGIVAEQGSVLVAGAIDASGAAGGRVRLAASESVGVDGSIAAHATAAEQHGGVVELLAENGGVRVGGSATVNVSGGADGDGGTVLLRLPRSGLLDTLLDADPANDRLVLVGSVSGARSVTIEGYQAYDDADGVLTAVELVADAANPRFADAAAFMANDAALRAALGWGADPALRIRPGIEIRSAGDLTLAADWNLFPWRFGEAPGALTLRAGGDLLFNGSLSDGFSVLTGNAGFQLSTTAPGESWGYRLVGGASHGSADPLGVRGLVGSAPVGAGNGDVRLGNGTATVPRMVRTGTGSIEIAAANDFVLGNQQSVVYTAGVSGPGIRFGTANNTLGSRAYPIDGGDISIAAGGHIRGAATNQFVNDWLWRVGLPAGGGPSGAVAWTVNFQRFQQNVGALGGGDVRVTAGGDITDFSVSLPSIGRQVGGTTLAASVVEVIGGGTLDVEAGGSILGGSYYVGRGAAALRAGDAIGAYTRAAGTMSLAPLLGLGDSAFAATARTDVVVDGIVNPSLLPPGLSQLPLGGSRRTSYFSSYSDTAEAALISIAGDLFLRNNTLNVINQLSSTAFLSGDALALRVAPPTLRGAALSGDVEIEGTWALFPAPKGNIEIFAQDSIRTASAQLALTDTPIGALPTIGAPAQNTLVLSLLTRTPPQNLRSFLNAPVPVHSDANQPDGVPDLAPVRIVAATGDVEMRGVGASDLFYFAKAARVIAGRDLVDVAVQAQHLRDTDLSLLQAGRDIRYSAGRDTLGRLEQNLRGVIIEGPGLLQVVAGRDIDLQTSQGIVTRGNFDNRFLPAGGASVSVLAGVGDIAALDSSAAIYEYLVRRPSYAEVLMAFVRAEGAEAATLADASAAFQLLPADAQREFFAALGLALPSGTDYVALLDDYLTERIDFSALFLAYVRENGSGNAQSATDAAAEFMTFDESLRSEFFASIDVTAPPGADHFALLEQNVLAPARAARTLVRYVNALAAADSDGDAIPTVTTLAEARGVFRDTLDAEARRAFFVTLGVELSEQPDYTALLDEYVVAPDRYAADLVTYVRRLGGTGATTAGALDEFGALDGARRLAFLEPILFGEIREGGRTAAKAGAANGDFTRAFDALEAMFPGSLPDEESGEANSFAGDIRLFFSRLYTLAGGDINVMAPGGEINVGLATPPAAFGVGKAASELGMVVQQTGSVSAIAYDDFQVNESRVFAADGGNVLVWSTEGDIDAGRGAKTAISAPPPTVIIDENGKITVRFPAALTGSGIQTLATSAGRKPGNVDLFAPRGVVNAGDAGIVAGNLTIAATAVLGADNISVSGVSVGVPVDTGGFAAALTGVSAVASSATNAAEDTVGPSRAEETATPLADQALGFLDVFVTGFGDGSTPQEQEREQEEEECDPATDDCSTP